VRLGENPTFNQILLRHFGARYASVRLALEAILEVSENQRPEVRERLRALARHWTVACEPFSVYIEPRDSVQSRKNALLPRLHDPWGRASASLGEIQRVGYAGTPANNIPSTTHTAICCCLLLKVYIRV
jgi:hypothetical protein